VKICVMLNAYPLNWSGFCDWPENWRGNWEGQLLWHEILWTSYLCWICRLFWERGILCLQAPGCCCIESFLCTLWTVGSGIKFLCRLCWYVCLLIRNFEQVVM
jgi:hypothetical protein